MDEQNKYSQTGSDHAGGFSGSDSQGDDFDRLMQGLGNLLNGVAAEVHHSLHDMMPELKKAGDELRKAFSDQHAATKAKTAPPLSADAKRAKQQRKLLQQRRKHMSGRRGWFHFLSVTGTIGCACLAIATLVIGSSTFFGYGTDNLLPFVLVFSITVAAWIITGQFRKVYKRLRLMSRYLEIIGARPCCSVMELAAGTAQSEEQTVSSLLDLIRRGEFPTAYLDPVRTTLFLDADLFREYMAGASASSAGGDAAPEKDKSPEEASQEQPASAEPDQQKSDLLQTGYAYVRQIARLASEITDPATANEARQISEISKHILDHVREHPDKLPQIRKFLDYYLPTTVKLLQSYTGYDQGGYTGSNAQAIRKNITGILKTIHSAFLNLLDSLFQEEALDISTDITVLKGLLDQEGLSEDGSGPFAVK